MIQPVQVGAAFQTQVRGSILRLPPMTEIVLGRCVSGENEIASPLGVFSFEAPHSCSLSVRNCKVFYGSARGH